MKLLNSILLFFLITTTTNFLSQELPPIKNFSTKDYGAENQNWAISQSENKFIYVANNEGLLEFNGAKWQLYLTPNETIIRSVKAFKDKIYTGFYMDFGYWQKNDFGVLEYTSLVKENAIELIEDEQVWEIIELDGWMLFKTFQRIYFYNLSSKSVKIIETKANIEKLVVVDDTLYFQEIGKGIFKVENGVPKLVSDDTVLKKNILVNIFEKEESLLFLTQEKGFYILKNNVIEPLDISANKEIFGKKIYSAIRLKNEDFVLGTVSNGLLYVENSGDLRYKITQSTGLSNNTVLSIFEDVDENIWLGLDNGIDYVNVTSAFHFYKDDSNFWGTIYTSSYFNGFLYLGTNQGLYYKKYGTNDAFKLVENTKGQVWSLTVIDDELFCGHDSGTYLVDEGVASMIGNYRGTWSIRKLRENVLIQGNYTGLYVLDKKNNNWSVKNKIQGFSNSSRYFEIINSNKIVVNHEYKNVYFLTIDTDFQKVIKMDVESSIDKSIYSSLVKYQDALLYGSKKGVFKYVENKKMFVYDSIYSQLISKKGFTSGKLIYDATTNKLWSFSKEDIRCLVPGKLSSRPELIKIPISESLRKGASGYENIIPLYNEVYLVGSSNGFIKVDLNLLSESEDFNVSINHINNFEIDQGKEKVSLSKSQDFHFRKNNLEFFYSVSNFDKISTIKYQYQLLGLNKDWSVPSVANSILFDNLSAGEYTFKVRGVIGDKVSKNEAVYTFTINKPWYFSNLMMILYALLIVLLFYVLHITSKKYYNKQRESLLEKARKDSSLKELESNKVIMKLNNDKLRSDIDAKNRELATSTMNIIKKNEFLNTIKTELAKGGERSLMKVIKIIDKNLNNNDDWKMFQEAFNNADEKFLKKIKSKHPDLTPNDLKLCAYLRLNLSSKEIAPLLNISPRSVEVKRYRLRKKMNLSHELNLTSCILEI